MNQLNIGSGALIGGTGVGAFKAGAREDEARGRQTAENSARLAVAIGNVTSHGWGEIIIPEPIEFSCTFIEQPSVAHGYACTKPLVTGRLPRAWGFVREWDKDEKGFYIRAFVAVVVDTIGPTTDPIPDPFDDPGYDLSHSFVFQAVAAKDVPTN